MTLLRPHDGPTPSHPILVVPDERSRRGALIRVRGWEVAVADPVAEVSALAELATAAQQMRWSSARVPGLPPFGHGLVGLVSDDVSPALLGLEERTNLPAPARVPPVWFGEYDHAVLRDPDGGWWVTGRSQRGLDAATALLRESASEEGRRTPEATPPVPPGAGGPALTTMTSQEHHAAIRQIHEWIGAGDVYQVNLTLHVGAAFEGPALALARRLFGASNHAAHAAYLHVPAVDAGLGATIASVSPETFLRIDGRRARVRPIKGTRRRSGDPAEDDALARDLEGAVKDRAEHVMIVDLERNDLGRICEVGSVSVPELMALERHPTVWHLTSTVEGTIRHGLGFDEVMAGLFPCGSVTGAPKRMAVDRIALLEPRRRGVYCGAIGVIGPGLVDLSVAIRTAVIDGQQVWYGTGGGIVIDSDPAAEWDEAMAKARPFFEATGTTPPSG